MCCRAFLFFFWFAVRQLVRGLRAAPPGGEELDYFE
jgi:hypothetical protein